MLIYRVLVFVNLRGHLLHTTVNHCDYLGGGYLLPIHVQMHVNACNLVKRTFNLTESNGILSNLTLNFKMFVHRNNHQGHLNVEG